MWDKECDTNYKAFWNADTPEIGTVKQSTCLSVSTLQEDHIEKKVSERKILPILATLREEFQLSHLTQVSQGDVLSLQMQFAVIPINS